MLLLLLLLLLILLSHTHIALALVFNHKRPLIALITEPDTLFDESKMRQTFRTLRKVKDDIDLFSIRLDLTTTSNDDNDNNLSRTSGEIEKLFEHFVSVCAFILKDSNVKVVVNDNVEVVRKVENVSGVHVKEHKMDEIPAIRHLLSGFKNDGVVIGTSVHSVASARKAVKLGVDYMFIGTCFSTQSHPGKKELEGPELIEKIKKELLLVCDGGSSSKIPCLLGIGGINSDNCHIPMSFGSDGVAVIRSILQARDPLGEVQKMKTKMKINSTVDTHL